MTGALLTLLLASCTDVSAASQTLEQTSNTGDLFVAMKEQEQELGFPLLRPSEQELPLEKQRLLAAARLRTACELVKGSAPSVRAHEGATLKEILDRPEFTGARDRGSDALAQLWRRLMDWIESMLGEKPAQTFADSVRLLVLGLAVAVAALAILRLSRLRWRRSERKSTVAQPAALELLDPEVHFSRAQELKAKDPRLALREGLLALLSSLERKRLARPDRVKTNRELAAELPERGASPELTNQVSVLLAGYDRSYYSLDEVRPEIAAGFLDGVANVQRALGSVR